MDILSKYTIQSLKKNKTRTLVTIIGVILSATMICAVTTFVSSIYNFMIQNTMYDNGSWHANYLDANYDKYQSLLDNKEIENITYYQILGYAKDAQIKNEFKPYIYVIGGADNIEDMLPIHITEGRFPKNNSEILLPEHLATNGGVKHKVGDTLALDIGKRMLAGKELNQDTPCYVLDDNYKEVFNGETIEVRENRVYKIVGFYERPDFEDRTAPGYTAITLADKESESTEKVQSADNNINSDSYQYDIYFNLKNPKKIYDFIKINNIEGQINKIILSYQGTSSSFNLDGLISGFSAIIILLIMFGSVSLIYNSFAISVSDRTKQFGLLSSVGATKKQLKQMVIFEAFVISIIGIPIGIIVGIAGISVTLMLIGHKFMALGYNVGMEVCVSAESVIIAIVLSLVTVLISAWIPSKRATTVASIDAIRQHRDINLKSKYLKTSRYTYKLFGLPGVIADKYFKRSRNKYRSTIVSLFLSIILFISASVFTDYLVETSESFSYIDYDLHLCCEKNLLGEVSKDDILEEISDESCVDDVVFLDNYLYKGTIKKEYLTKNYIQKYNYNELGNRIIETYDVENTELYDEVNIKFVNDSEFIRLLNKYNLDKEKFMDAEKPLAITVDCIKYYDNNINKIVEEKHFESDEFIFETSILNEYVGYEKEGKYIDAITAETAEDMICYNSGDGTGKLMVPVSEAYTRYPFYSGKIIDDELYYISTDATEEYVMLYPYSMKEYVIPNWKLDDIELYNYYVLAKDYKVAEKVIERIYKSNSISNYDITNYGEILEEERNTLLIIKVFSYGFIVLISLIAAANVFNTMSTSINLRRREFAMLKSVGMSKKGFNLMMNYECVLYGIRALSYGLPVSIIIAYLIHLVVLDGVVLEFRWPVKAMGMATLSVFIVVFISMMYGMSKIKNKNPIDALKNENI